MSRLDLAVIEKSIYQMFYRKDYIFIFVKTDFLGIVKKKKKKKKERERNGVQTCYMRVVFCQSAPSLVLLHQLCLKKETKFTER